MSAAAAPAPVPAAAAPGAADAEHGSMAASLVKSVFAGPMKRHKEFKAQQAAARPAAKTKATKAKAPPKAPDAKTRLTAQYVINTSMPPPRLAAAFVEGLQTPKTLRHADLSKKIRAARAALKGPSAEEALKGAVPPTPQQAAAIEASIAQIESVIEAEGLGDELIRLSANVGAALAAAIDLLCLQALGVFVANTFSAEQGLIDQRWTLHPGSLPSPDQGGVRLDNSSVGPFFAQLPVVLEYDQAAEDAEKARIASEKKESQKASEAEKQARLAKAAELTAEITSNMMAMIARLEQHAAAGTPAQTPNGQIVPPEQIPAQIAAIRQNIENGVPAQLAETKVNENRVKPARKVTNDRGYLTYIGDLCTQFKKLEDQFAKLRVSERTKHVLDEMVRAFVPALAKAMRKTMKGSRTIDGHDILNSLVAMQLFAGRPEEEIEGLTQTVENALALHKAHSITEKSKKEVRDQEKLAAMTPAERAAREHKKIQERQEQLSKSIAAQQRRAETARTTAAAKAAELQQLQAAAAATAQAAAAAPAAAPAAQYQMPAAGQYQVPGAAPAAGQYQMPGAAAQFGGAGTY